MWDLDTGTLHALGHKNDVSAVVMFEGYNGNLATMKMNPLFRNYQRFKFDPKTKFWQADATRDAIGFDWGNWLADDSVISFKEPNALKQKSGVKWNIYYCEE